MPSQLCRFAVFLSIFIAIAAMARAEPDTELRIPLSASDQLDLRAILSTLSDQAGIEVQIPDQPVHVPVDGVAGTLTLSLLRECLGDQVDIEVTPDAVHLRFPGPELQVQPDRILALAEQTRRASERKNRYGMRPRASYCANDPERPTVVLIHGINSTSYSFVHVLPELERAGYGLILYDFPYNRSLEDSARQFTQDWTRLC